MCTIDKMLIKGIRSFSPDNNAVITFFKPLTLIVGPNGAGKTTIIECLKNACTGELPPNARSGHTFIHDPKVAGETETKGQIKLRFKTAAGKDVVCIRSFQLTQKASKMEYKAIESVLQTINSNTGEKVCLSYRCADMDREVPALMGVSKAILENVIFVHQDEANWPLAEASVLKKKFDDIFSSTRYTKALEVIKKLHKEQSQSIKEYKLKMEHLQTLKNSANKLQENIDSDKEKSEHLQNEIQNLDEKISSMNEKINELQNKISSIKNMKEEIRFKENKKEMLTLQRIQQYNDLEKENEGTDEELQRWQANFDSGLLALQRKISKIEKELTGFKEKAENEKINFNNNCKFQGRLQAEAEANLVEQSERDACLKNIFSKHEIANLTETPFSDAAAENHTNTIIHFLNEKQSKLERLKGDNKVEIEKINSLIGKTHADIIEADGRIKLLKTRKLESQQEIRKIHSELQISSVSEHQIREINEEERCANERMDALGKKIQEQHFEEGIEEKKRQVSNIEQKMKVLQREKDGLASESAERISLRMKRESLNKKTQQLNEILEKNRKSFNIAMENKIPEPEHIFSEIIRIIRANSKSYFDIEEEAKAAGKEVAALSMRMNDLNSQMNSKKKELESKKDFLSTRLFEAIQKELDVETMEEQMESAQSEMNRKKRDHDLLDGMRRCFSRFIEIAEETHKCPVCERQFSSQEEHDAFTKRQKKNQSESGEKLQRIASQRAAAEGKVRSLEQLKPIFQDHQKIRNETLPSLQKSINETKEALEKATEHHDDLIGILAQMESEHELVKELESPSREMSRLWKETESMKEEIAAGEKKMDEIVKGGRTMEDLNLELSRLENQRNVCLEAIDKLRVDQQRMKDDYSNLNLKWRQLREEKMSIAQKVQKAQELKSKLDRTKEHITLMDTEARDWEGKLIPLQDSHKSLSSEAYSFKEKASREEERRAEELRNLQREVDQLKSHIIKIQQFQSSGKEVQLKELGEMMSRSLSRQKDIEERIKELTEAYEKEKQSLHNQNSLKRNIDDNINYRKTIREEKAMEKELLLLQEKVRGIGSLEDMDEELNKMHGQTQSWLAEQNRSRGAVAAYEGNMKQNLSNLKTPQYKDIHFRFKSQFIQLKTTELANKDLDKYYTALDRALMRFHAMKMEEINGIIRELWQQTYRGQDIDYIQIRSDAEGAGTRSYSYRVVMKSGDAELDMRGRCSAGQKVLASLVIRLALAETFCLNCGILALDEPTTNLDLPNSQSLASALQRIMEERRNQENFQLVVITHDENFAQMIGQRQHAENYFRISKDENQHSRIEMQGILD